MEKGESTLTTFDKLDEKAIESIVENGLCPLCGGQVREDLPSDHLQYHCPICGKTFGIEIDDGSSKKRKSFHCPRTDCKHNYLGKSCGTSNDALSWEVCREFLSIYTVPYVYKYD
jgi:hypothetical protein